MENLIIILCIGFFILGLFIGILFYPKNIVHYGSFYFDEDENVNEDSQEGENDE